MQMRAIAVIIKEKRILLCRRSKGSEHYPDHWTIPGGALENGGRSFTEFLEKLISSQLGLPFSADKKLWFYETITKKVHAVSHAFLGHLEGDESTIKVKRSNHSEFSWVAYDDLKDLDLAFSDWEVIEDLAQEGLL